MGQVLLAHSILGLICNDRILFLTCLSPYVHASLVEDFVNNVAAVHDLPYLRNLRVIRVQLS